MCLNFSRLVPFSDRTCFLTFSRPAVLVGLKGLDQHDHRQASQVGKERRGNCCMHTKVQCSFFFRNTNIKFVHEAKGLFPHLKEDQCIINTILLNVSKDTNRSK